MNFHGMKRKELQALCKKHGIPANLKNIEMAARLASVFEKETVEEPKEVRFSTKIQIPKKVRFSTKIQIFEFSSSSVKRRRSKRMLVKNNVKEVSMDSEFHDTEKYHRKDVQDDPKVEKVPRRSRRFVNDIDVQTNIQDRRRSIRLKATAANTSMGVETSDGRRLCSDKECKEERKTKQRSTVVNSEEGEVDENNVKCYEVDEIKDLSLPLPRNNNASAFDELAIFTTTEKKLMLMEQISEKGKTVASDSVTHHNAAAVESHAVAFTTPKQVSSLGDAGIGEAGKEEEHIATNFLDVINTTERYLMLGGSKQTEAINEGESIVVELHDESDIATSLGRQFSVGDSKGERSGRNEDNRTAENYVSDGARYSGGNEAMTFHEESVVFTGPEGDLFGSFGQDKAIESEGKKVVQFYEECGLSTGLHSDQALADSEQSETGWEGINSVDKSGLFTSVKRQLLYEASEQKEAVKTGEKASAEFHDGYVVPNIPEDSDEAAKGEENKHVELRVDSGIFTSAEKHLLLETDEGVKGDNITAKSHVVSDILAAAESFSAGKQEQKEVDDSVVQEDSKDSQAEDDVGLDATKGTSKISREQSPHVDSANLFDFDIEEAETILEAERNVSFRSNVLALPAKGNSENYLEVAGTGSMVSEESGPSTDNQNQLNDVLEELAITDNNEADELIEAKNIQMGFEGNLLLNSSSGSYVSGKTCILAGTENEDEAGVRIATAFEKAISLTSDELTVQNHMNEKDEEMITRETTPISEEMMQQHLCFYQKLRYVFLFVLVGGFCLYYGFGFC